MNLTGKIPRLFYLPALLAMLFNVSMLAAAAAETRYVTDILLITLRNGKGDKFEVLKTLKTDTPLELIEEDGKYLKVKTQDGITGWVLEQYVTKDRPKAQVIESLRRENSRLKSKVDQLESELSPIRESLAESKKSFQAVIEKSEKKIAAGNEEIARLTSELDQMNEKYATLAEQSQDTLQLIVERKKLKQANISMTEQISNLESDNSRMKRNYAVRWFLAGGGVFLAGLLFGRSAKKKKYY